MLIILDNYSNIFSEHLMDDYIMLTNIIDARPLQRRKIFYDGTVILDKIECIGSEGSLTDCPGSGYGNFGGCSDIAVAYCEGIIVTLGTYICIQYNKSACHMDMKYRQIVIAL